MASPDKGLSDLHATALAQFKFIAETEQPQRARCTVLLDTRRLAYQGAGPGSAFEWAVSGAASALDPATVATPTSGGAGTSTSSKDPWMAAQPWMQSNIAQGQNLQGQYTKQPFNQAQLDAYGNMGAQSDYMRNLIPGLLGTASRQQNGFDRSNPNARPEAYNFNATGGQGGLLGSLTGRAMANYGSANPMQQAPQQDGGMGTFVQQGTDPFSQRQMAQFAGTSGGYGDLMANGARARKDGPAMFNGGYGEYKYGMDTPQPGTKAYRDMMEYIAYGGADPYGILPKTGANAGLLGAGGAAGHGQHAEYLLGDRLHHADGTGDQERDLAGGLCHPRP